MQGDVGSQPDGRGDHLAGDAALVAAVVRGERPALAALYDRHARLLLAVALRIVHDRAAAEDLLHDVFLEAWHHADGFDPARGSVRAWLVTRMRSRALDRRGSALRQARLAEDAGRAQAVAGGGGSGGAGDRDGGGLPPGDGDRVRARVARLPPELAAVVELAYFEGLSSSEMAARLGIPSGTVKSRMARALATLREDLGLSGAGGAASPGAAGGES